MLNILGIVIGLVFVLLLFSLLASTVMEVIAAIFSLRSRHLRYTLENMLAEKTADFVQHPMFKQLSYATSRRARISPYSMPAYISKETFSAIVADMMEAKNSAALARKINQLDEGDLKRMMQFLFRRADGNPAVFKAEVDNWFDKVMERASDWYRRNLKWWLFAVGLVLAAIFNADTIKIYQSISASAITQDFLVEMATEFEQRNDTIAGPDLTLSLEESLERLNESVREVEQFRSALGLGWMTDETERTLPWWLIKLAGLLLTAIAVTLGAPFWFDLLRKMLSLRQTSAEKEAPPHQASESPEEPNVLTTRVVEKSVVEEGGGEPTVYDTKIIISDDDDDDNIEKPVG